MMKKLLITLSFCLFSISTFADGVVEYYPATGIYVAMYEGEYLKAVLPGSEIVWKWGTGIAAADHFETFEEAVKMIHKYKEQHEPTSAAPVRTIIITEKEDEQGKSR